MLSPEHLFREVAREQVLHESHHMGGDEGLGGQHSFKALLLGHF